MIVALLLVVSLLPPAPTDTGFAAAAAAYRDRDYVAAMQGFGLLASAEPDATRRAILHANAGTAAARAGDSRRGEAVWHLSMARRLDPSDRTARVNLARLRALAESATPGAPAVAVGASPGNNGGTRDLGNTLRDLPLELTPQQSRQGAAALVGFGLLLASLWRARPQLAGRRLLGWSALLLVALPPLLLAWSSGVRADAARQAVVLGEVVPLRSEPQDDGMIQFRLAGGSIVTADDARPGWRLVETAEGARGWLPEGHLRLIDPWTSPGAD